MLVRARRGTTFSWQVGGTTTEGGWRMSDDVGSLAAAGLIGHSEAFLRAV
jgi:hypothetical protein